MPPVRKSPAPHFASLLIAIALAMLAILAGGCTREPQAPLRVGSHIWPGFEPLYLAREQGYYSSESVRMVEYTSGSGGIRAFRAGAIDAAAMTIDEALLLIETTSDVRVVLVLDVSHGADVILTQPTLSSLHELKGRRVGLETTALGAYVLTRALETVGLTPSDVHTVPLESIEQERAFKEGRVDAIVSYEPFRTKILALGARQVFDSSQIPGEIVDVLVVRRSLVANHKAQIRQLVQGWFKALDFIRREPNRAASLMARREGLSAGAFRKTLKGLRFYDLKDNRSMLTGPSPALVAVAQRLGHIMLSNRLLERPPELEGVLDGSFVQEVSP